jgi:hypothetical protein
VFGHRPFAAFLAAAAISLSLPTAVSAGFVSVSGAGNILDPATTPTGATRDFFDDTGADRLVHGWNERQDVTLDRDIYVDLIHPGVYDHNSDLGYFNQYRIASGSVVSSHLLYFDPKNPYRVEGVSFVFDAPIVGIIVASDRFFTANHNFTDYFLDTDFLGNPLTLYPTTHFDDRGLELNQFDDFTFSVSGDRLYLNWGASTPGDQIRVITARPPSPEVNPVPGPPAILLALAGGASLGVGRLLRRRAR